MCFLRSSSALRYLYLSCFLTLFVLKIICILYQIAIVIGRAVTSRLFTAMFEAFAVIDAKMGKTQRTPADTPPADSSLTGISKGLGILIKAVLKNTDMTASFGILIESLDSCLADKELSKRIGGVVVKSLWVIFRYLQVYTCCGLRKGKRSN